MKVRINGSCATQLASKYKFARCRFVGPCLYSCQDHFFFQAEDGIRDYKVTGVQTCALPISGLSASVVQFFSSSALQFSSAIALSAITLRHIWPSAARKSSSWAWVWGFLAARVWLPRALANSGLSMTLLTAACRVLRASAGVPAGTAMPNQVEALKPGTPDSAMEIGRAHV